MSPSYSALNDLRRGDILKAQSELHPSTNWDHVFSTVLGTTSGPGQLTPNPAPVLVARLPLPSSCWRHKVYGNLISSTDPTDNSYDWFIGELRFIYGESPVAVFPVEFFNTVGSGVNPRTNFVSVFSGGNNTVDSILITRPGPIVYPDVQVNPFEVLASADRVELWSTNSVVSGVMSAFLGIKSFNC